MLFICLTNSNIPPSYLCKNSLDFFDVLSVSYNEIISVDLSLVNRLNDADRALENWKSLKINSEKKSNQFTVLNGIRQVKSNSKAKFDETIEIAMNLGVDPRHADQMVRGVVAMPNGTGK